MPGEVLFEFEEPLTFVCPDRDGQLLAFMRHTVAAGVSCIFISHLLGEVLENCDRIEVMRLLA